ncbi:1-acyl-sn-glycerol-3-phosphate acyltransferase [candidate division WOR-3 bacterium]|nr:1-acyl-sn-glycerol-3-phosphate acyltransferase [candidate division WOR-3 bacterium]
MKKTFVSIMYIVFFWIVIPFVLIAGSRVIDQTDFLPTISGFGVVGWFIAIVSAGMLLISIVQFAADAGVLPISAYPPGHIIRRGIYAFYRHPIYLFYISMFIGIALIMGSAGMLLVVVPVFVMAVVLYAAIEEHGLLRRFGQDYQAYKEQAGLVIPRFHMILSILFFVLSKLFFPITVVNKQYIPKRSPFFLVANHRNYLDPFFIAFTLPYKVHYVTTYEMFRKRATSLFFGLLGCIPKKRYLHDTIAVKRIIQVLKKGGVIGIFPEGERSYSGDVLGLKSEPMKLFQKFPEVPILPVAVSGNYIMWPRWGRGWRACRITVTYRPLITIRPDDTLEQIQNRIARDIVPDDAGRKTFYIKRAHSIECFLYRCPVCREFDRLRSCNTRFYCSACHRQWHMQETYALTDDKDGKVSTIQDMFDAIRVTRTDIEAQRIISSGPCEVSIERGTIFSRLFIGRVQLCDGELLARPDDRYHEPVRIAMRDLLAATLEGNRKLQVYDIHHRRLYQFIFEHESARKWQDYIAEARYATCSEYPIVR